jgi:parvulin-like peptidyl-prolyl isomerase
MRVQPARQRQFVRTVVRPVALAAAMIGVFAWGARSVARSPGHAEPGGTSAATVALVNGAPISDDELGVRLGELLPLTSYHGRVDPARLLSLRRAALDELVLDELIYREATDAGKRPSSAAVDAELADVKARFADEGEFANALAENRLTEAAFRARLARAIVIREARAAHERQTITEADVVAYYRANGQMFERPESVHLLEILVRRDPANPRSAQAAERRARATLARLERGEPFDRLARELSDDEYRVKDGDMGFVHRGRLDSTFEQAVFAAPIGRFEIAESLYGFEVFEVLERKPAEQLTLDEARRIIAERLERLRREQAVRAWHATLLAGARIDIRDHALRDARPADTPATSMRVARTRRVAPAGGRP